MYMYVVHDIIKSICKLNMKSNTIILEKMDKIV